jgi:phosphatidylglycerophosphate synthase
MPTTFVTAATTPAPTAVRIQTSVLSRLERQVLVWLAHRLPKGVSSDHLTALALVAMIGVGASYWLSATHSVGLLLATLGLALNWFGDSLDGTLARVRQQQRPRFGYYVDHVVDAVGALALFGGLAASGYMTPAVAAVLVIAYFLLCLEVYLAAHAIGHFQMSFLGMGPTELRLLLAVGNLAVVFHPTVTLGGHLFKLFDVGGVIGAAALFLTFMATAIRNTRRLYREEPLPVAPSGR